MMQAVVGCVALSATRDVANAVFHITIPNNEVEVTDVITQASYGWSTTERLNVGSGNAFNGPDTWDGVLTVHALHKSNAAPDAFTEMERRAAIAVDGATNHRER